jgi:hypothetical protein
VSNYRGVRMEEGRRKVGYTREREEKGAREGEKIHAG